MVVKLKLHDFTLLTRRMTLQAPVSDTRTLHDACLELLERFPLEGARVRLTGVSAQDLGAVESRPAAALPGPETGAPPRAWRTFFCEPRSASANKPITFASLLEDTTPKTAPEGDLERIPAARRRNA